MIRRDRWKLVVGRADRRPTMLFDLKEDPYELSNLVAGPSSQDRVSELRV